MKRFLFWLLVLGFLGAGIIGCGGSGEKGINSGKDKPKPAAS